ncbi:MAG: hypothetical protein AAF378_20995 [Cyanobacteria bacterium P01_A01_bin.84]
MWYVNLAPISIRLSLSLKTRNSVGWVEVRRRGGASRIVTQLYQRLNLGRAIAYGRSLTIAYGGHPWDTHVSLLYPTYPSS